MSEQPYMQLWIADFLGDTLHLSSDEIGQYMLILMAMWRAGGYLANDEVKLARIARGKVSEAVMSFLTLAKGNVCQKRLLEELEKARAKSAARSEAGKAGAEAKALKNKKRGQANAIANAKAKVLAKVQHLPEPEPLATNVANKDMRAKPAPIPSDWQPSSENLSWARKKSFPPDFVTTETERHQTWAEARGVARADWSASWRNWLMREWKATPANGSKPPGKEHGGHRMLAYGNKVIAEERAKKERSNVIDGDFRSDRQGICGGSDQHVGRLISAAIKSE